MKKRNKNSSKALTAFHVMAKPVGPICNTDCRYCFYLEKENLYGNKQDWAIPIRRTLATPDPMCPPCRTPSWAWPGTWAMPIGSPFVNPKLATLYQNLVPGLR